MEPLYSGHPWGTKCWPLYRGGPYWGVVLYTHCIEVAFIQGWPVKRVPLYTTWFSRETYSWLTCQCHYSEVAFIQGWPLRGIPLYTTWFSRETCLEFNATIHLLYICSSHAVLIFICNTFEAVIVCELPSELSFYLFVVIWWVGLTQLCSKCCLY